MSLVKINAHFEDDIQTFEISPKSTILQVKVNLNFLPFIK